MLSTGPPSTPVPIIALRSGSIVSSTTSLVPTASAPPAAIAAAASADISAAKPSGADGVHVGNLRIALSAAEERRAELEQELAQLSARSQTADETIAKMRREMEAMREQMALAKGSAVPTTPRTPRSAAGSFGMALELPTRSSRPLSGFGFRRNSDSSQRLGGVTPDGSVSGTSTPPEGLPGGSEAVQQIDKLRKELAGALVQQQRDRRKTAATPPFGLSPPVVEALKWKRYAAVACLSLSRSLSFLLCFLVLCVAGSGISPVHVYVFMIVLIVLIVLVVCCSAAEEKDERIRQLEEQLKTPRSAACTML